jgi:hypothetical protein
VFSDLLLSQLPPRELLAVFAHEIGHVAKHHVVVFVAWSMAFFIGADLAAVWLAVDDQWLALAVLAATVAGWYLAFGWFSRRSELDADLHSIAVTGDVDAMVSALEIVGGPHSRAQKSWRHFSTARRVEFLRDVQRDASIGTRLQRKLRRIGAVGVVLGGLAIAAEAWTLSRSYREDEVRVLLALDASADAVAALRRVDDPDAELARLVALANSPPVEAARLEDLSALANEARKRGDLLLAADLYTLAQLRGVTGLDAQLEELAELLRTESR